MKNYVILDFSYKKSENTVIAALRQLLSHVPLTCRYSYGQSEKNNLCSSTYVSL